MQATIAVAAITAGSTLAAAGLTGYLTLILHKRQATAERRRAREEARRQAYADLLTASTNTWLAIDKLWQLRPPQSRSDSPPQEFSDVAESLKKLDHALHLAVLHGPRKIAPSAADLYFEAQKEFLELGRLLVDNAGDSRTALDIHPGNVPDRAARMGLRSTFVGEAMRATGADVGT
ncbi:hypothetical protein [Streptomyces sp. NBC_01361]|uniref:hypothetical protein n=1 Tax=Streptomyces sp. NBC_01361 TaxID=2903838 RepID=UPI002E365C01|nr:hypothetical protein [Streptomyces sp. NBC_01361]